MSPDVSLSQFYHSLKLQDVNHSNNELDVDVNVYNFIIPGLKITAASQYLDKSSQWTFKSQKLIVPTRC
jgi:hypothetical protein